MTTLPLTTISFNIKPSSNELRHLFDINEAFFRSFKFRNDIIRQIISVGKCNIKESCFNFDDDDDMRWVKILFWLYNDDISFIFNL